MQNFTYWSIHVIWIPAFIRRATARLTSADLWAFNGILVLVFGLGIAAWSASQPEEIPSFYIVRWQQSGKCSVMVAPPENGNFRLIWHGNLRLSANEKLKEFMRMKRCS